MVGFEPYKRYRAETGRASSYWVSRCRAQERAAIPDRGARQPPRAASLRRVPDLPANVGASRRLRTSRSAARGRSVPRCARAPQSPSGVHSRKRVSSFSARTFIRISAYLPGLAPKILVRGIVRQAIGDGTNRSIHRMLQDGWRAGTSAVRALYGQVASGRAKVSYRSAHFPGS